MKVAINGFGRIGRAAFKILFEKITSGEDVQIVAINDLASAEELAYLLKHDTVYGTFSHNVSVTEKSIIVDTVEVPLLAEKDPLVLPWKDMQVDVVIECTGVFSSSEGAAKHLTAGAKKVLLSAPAKDDGFKTLVFGSDALNNLLNPNPASGVSSLLDAAENPSLVSNASCTTNCITPVMRILEQAFGVEKAMLTTVHAYTSTQSLVDSPNKKDVRRGRAAAQNIVPASTGAAKATTLVQPNLKNNFDGVALRVPVPSGSISDITALLKRDVTLDELNQTLKEYSQKDEFKNVVKYSEELLVSSDIVGSPYSSIIDSDMTRVVGGNLVKVMAWYDNEWGYSNRLVEMAILLGKKL